MTLLIRVLGFYGLEAILSRFSLKGSGIRKILWGIQVKPGSTESKGSRVVNYIHSKHSRSIYAPHLFEVLSRLFFSSLLLCLTLLTSITMLLSSKVFDSDILEFPIGRLYFLNKKQVKFTI